MKVRVDGVYGWLANEVFQLSKERGIPDSRAFAVWLLTFVHEMDTDQALDATDTLVGNGGVNEGVAAWFRDDEEQVFHLWQCKWSTDENEVFDRTCGDELIDAFHNMLNPTFARSIGHKFALIADDLKHAVERSYSVSLNVGVPTSLPQESLDQLTEQVHGIAKTKKVCVSIRFYDAEHLHALDRDRNPDNETLEGHDIEFDLANEQTMELSSDTALPTGWRAWVANISADSLGRQAKLHGSRLFSLNVRYALSRRLKRIERIHTTLSDPTAARFFWFYNNGITMLADKCEIRERATGERYLLITNPQVVNGCQTVSAFSYQLGRYEKSVSVLARVILPPSDAAGREQARLISENTNTQSPVFARDLRTNDPLHKDLAAMMSRLSPPWFYEIKRGQWETQKGDNAKKYGDRRIDMERLAQSFLMQTSPAESLTRKKGIFEEQETYELIFSRSRIAADYLFPELCRRYFEGIWHHDRYEEIRALCGDQMSDEVIICLLAAKGQVVAHCVALTRQLLEAEGLWTAETAKPAYALLAGSARCLDVWMPHLGRGFYQLREHAAEQAAAETKPLNLKKYLERGEQASLKELWNGISSGAGLWLGKNWRKKVVEQIAAKGASA